MTAFSSESVPPSTQPAALAQDRLDLRPPNFLQRLRSVWQRAVLSWGADDAFDGVAAGRFRARQLQALYRFTPVAGFATLCFPLSIAYSFWPHTNARVAILLWVLSNYGCFAYGVRGWRAWVGPARQDIAPPQMIRETILYGAVYGLTWACAPALFFPLATPKDQLLILSLTAGLISGGGLVFSSVVPAALAFVVTAITGTVFALTQAGDLTNIVLLALLYASTISALVVSGARVLMSNLRAEAQLERQNQTIGLLLRDFEEHASDWLWETTLSGRLRHVSSRLAESLGRSRESLIGAPLVDLMASSLGTMAPEEFEALNQLRQHLHDRAAFRDIAVPVSIAHERRWWSLTAKPLFDEHGHAIGWRGVGTDVTHARQAHLEMVRMANFDALTGLANRHQFSLHLDRLRSSSVQNERACTLLFLDLDNFKYVNDSLGHAVGDRLLYMVAKRLQTCTTSGDLLARLGGDEFALISWSVTHPEEVAALAERLLDCFSEPYVIDGASIEVATSVGIAMAPWDGSDPQTLLKNADLALYAAKASGRNTFSFFDMQMEERSRRRISMQRDLREALAKEELRVFFQPQIRLDDGSVSGFEALARWHHPQRGWVAPGEFIPIAEETGLISPLGRWVLQQACTAAREWPASVRVAVNLSALQFRSSSVVDLVSEALERSGLAPNRLELEITESALVQDSSTARATLMALRRRGVRVALDDFGTGYSSLAYLRTFPLDKLKVDVMFVRALGGDTHDDLEARAILRAIVSLADALQLETTAEGVEVANQLQAVRALGCTHVQGFLMAKPMPGEELSAYLQSLAA